MKPGDRLIYVEDREGQERITIVVFKKFLPIIYSHGVAIFFDPHTKITFQMSLKAVFDYYLPYSECESYLDWFKEHETR